MGVAAVAAVVAILPAECLAAEWARAAFAEWAPAAHVSVELILTVPAHLTAGTLLAATLTAGISMAVTWLAVILMGAISMAAT